MNDSSNETIIAQASFNPRVKNYWLSLGTIICIFTVVGIPFLLIWIPLGLFLTGRILKSIQCTLTDKALKVKKGIWVRTEKTIPLEKITDLGMVQGPLMRHFDVEQLSVETAGQSGPGALVQVQGIIGAREFRQKVLDQKDLMAGQSKSPSDSPSVSSSAHDDSTLNEIRDSLLRIEKLLTKKFQ